MFGFGKERKKGSKWVPFSGPARFRRLISDLKSDETAGMMPIIALSAVALVAAAGIAVDAARAIYVKDILQRSVDAAGLAAGHALDPDDSLADAQEFFDANFESALGVANQGQMIAVPSADGDVISITGSANLNATFMRIFGFDSLSVEATAEITRDTRGMELVLVMDNTGSMDFAVSDSDSTRRIDALLPAARNLVNIVYGDADENPNLWVSVVPFVATVNVGSNQTNFLSAAGQQRIVDGDYSTAGWKGCVLARSGGIDQTDATPGTSPIEPFIWEDTDPTYDPNNSNHFGLSFDGNGRDNTLNRNNWQGTRFFRQFRNATLQTREATINEVNDTGSVRGPGVDENGRRRRKYREFNSRGPNRACSPVSILPLTANRQTVLNKIDEMEPFGFGGTTTNFGLVWGWRAISPNWQGLWTGGDNASELPFPYEEPFMDKVIVLLTDGENTLSSVNETSFGLRDEFEDSPDTVEANHILELNRRLTTTCNNIKATNEVILYTIALSDGVDSTTQDLLRSCASNPNFFFFAGDSDSLSSAFDTIGRQLSRLRLSR